MNTVKKQYNTVVSQARKGVPGFENSYAKFIEKVTIAQNSKSLIVNYSRSLVYLSLHFTRPPHQVSVDEINAYLYRIMVHEQCSVTYFKHANAISNTNYPENLNNGHQNDKQPFLDQRILQHNQLSKPHNK